MPEKPAQHPTYDRLIRQGWSGWLTLYGFWTAPFVLTMLAAVGLQRSTGETVHFGWLLLDQALLWYFWASVCPLIYRLIQRFPLSRHTWYLYGPIYLALAIAAALLLTTGLAIIRANLSDWQGTTTEAIKTFVFGIQSFRYHFMNFIFFTLVTVTMTMIHYLRRQQEQEREADKLALKTAQLASQLTNARLDSLRSQLHPHFLFNALNSIGSLIKAQDNPYAYRTVARLGTLLRSTLDTGSQHTHTLDEELEFIERYLAIEKVRFSDRLQVEYTIPDKCRSAVIPALILQPLIENSIRHGIAKRPGSGLIGITADCDGRHVRLQVYDDGPGLPEGWTFESNAGIGLTNVRQRLTILYNGGHRLDIANRPTNGCSTSILMPHKQRTGEARPIKSETTA